MGVHRRAMVRLADDAAERAGRRWPATGGDLRGASHRPGCRSGGRDRDAGRAGRLFRAHVPAGTPTGPADTTPIPGRAGRRSPGLAAGPHRLALGVRDGLAEATPEPARPLMTVYHLPMPK